MNTMRVPPNALLALAALLLCANLRAIPAPKPQPDWTEPIAPFRITDHVYYVGSRGLASYLIVTSQGDILINSNIESSPALIQKSVEQLGFHFRDIRILLISHAHWDHDAGSAGIERLTHAQYMVMDSDVPVVESGGAKDFAYPDIHYPAVKVDRVLHDLDQVKLGGETLVAHKTPGHTRGCTTWTLRTMDRGKMVNVVIVGSWNVNPGYRLIDRPGKPASYPGISDDYRKAFEILASLPCDVFLGAHGEYYDMATKLDRIKAGSDQSVWIDPDGYRAAVAERKQAFETELKKQQAAR
jgi:metallo-beta-lactamase class B